MCQFSFLTEAAKKGYTGRLGLALIADEEHWVTVGGKSKGSELHLCQASENMSKPIALEPGPSEIVLTLSGEFRAECKRLKEAGVEFSHDPERAPWGWYATIRYPDGNEHYLMPVP